MKFDQDLIYFVIKLKGSYSLFIQKDIILEQNVILFILIYYEKRKVLTFGDKITSQDSALHDLIYSRISSSFVFLKSCEQSGAMWSNEKANETSGG